MNRSNDSSPLGQLCAAAFDAQADRDALAAKVDELEARLQLAELQLANAEAKLLAQIEITARSAFNFKPGPIAFRTRRPLTNVGGVAW